jgi:ABC-2 type transport system ATP-binding protein
VRYPSTVNASTQSATGSAKQSAVTGCSLCIRDLRKSFAAPRAEIVRAVDGIDLEVFPGECFGLLGPNGAGKTTTIEICEGLTKPDSGTVELLGLSWNANAEELRQRIGVQLQETQFPEKITVEEILRLFRSFYRRGLSADEAIGIAQLEEKRRARVGGLSGGQKQRLAMATALVGDPELLFLDEPTTGLDPQARRHLWDLVDDLKHSGRTIILTTHYMEEAERLCDRVAIMDHGKVIALGTPKELIALVGGENIVEFAISSPVTESRTSPHRPATVSGESGAEATAHAAIDPEIFTAIPGVCGHRVDHSLHQLSVSELHTTVPAIFAALREHGLHLSEFRTHSASLEDVFVRLTGRNLRDE